MNVTLLNGRGVCITTASFRSEYWRPRYNKPFQYANKTKAHSQSPRAPGPPELIEGKRPCNTHTHTNTYVVGCNHPMNPGGEVRDHMRSPTPGTCESPTWEASTSKGVVSTIGSRGPTANPSVGLRPSYENNKTNNARNTYGQQTYSEFKKNKQHMKNASQTTECKKRATTN